jgi:hypothetical protein
MVLGKLVLWIIGKVNPVKKKIIQSRRQITQKAPKTIIKKILIWAYIILSIVDGARNAKRNHGLFTRPLGDE